MALRKHNIVLLVGAHFPGRGPGKWENYVGGLGIVMNLSMCRKWALVLVDDNPPKGEWYHCDTNLEALGNNVDAAAILDCWPGGEKWKLS